ncbi:MAG TPA: PD-(D/E)XK nuclease family protein, partial [Actinomycetota bacterium]
EALEAAGAVAGRSVLDAFSALWRSLPYARRLVRESDRDRGSPEDRRPLDAVVAFAGEVERAGEGADRSTEAFLQGLEAGRGGPGTSEVPAGPGRDSVRILTAHGTAGLEFDTVVVAGTVEGNFPSLSRPEPMFDLALLERPRSQSDRNRERLEDERRLFDVVSTRARRRLVLTASDPHGEEPVASARSRFVAERGIAWQPVPGVSDRQPLSRAEAVPLWRRTLADRRVPSPTRLAALWGLLALGVRPETWWFQRDWTRTDQPLHDHVRVSYSKLDKLDNCALQFVLSEELGLEGQAGYYAWVGHLVHSLIEDVEAGRVERSEEAMIRAAEERWRPQQFPSMAVSEAFRASVTKRMIPAWFGEYADSPTLASEVRFEFEFQEATLTGFIDRVAAIRSGGTQITDYKTGKGRDARADDNLQLGIYFLAINHAEELAPYRPVKAVELAFLKETRNGAVKRVQLGLNSKAQQEYEEAMSARLAGLVDRLRELQATEVYRPDPRAECRYCDFKTLCPLWPEGRELFPAAAEPEGARP